MSNRNKEPRPRYTGPRDSVTHEILPPINWERSGKTAAEFDSEKWLEENGYRVEKSYRKVASRRATKQSS
ncbi:MAG: hypothetical protein QNJ14_00995 [Woeseiaceae bacterium]|nr:hypothetical protein [Woeseiaceae bacterium]